jgi:hypothetical protein
MDVRKARHHVPICINEIESAKKALCPVMPDALFAGAGITLIAVYEDLLNAALAVRRPGWNFFGQPDLIIGVL